MVFSGPEIRRVVLDIPSEHIPKLLEVLGPLVTCHNLKVEFCDPYPHDDEAIKYNPKRVEWFTDPVMHRRVAVVTRARLLAFEKARREELPTLFGTSHQASRICNAAEYNLSTGDRIVLPYVFAEGGEMRGFLAARLPEFGRLIEDGTIDIPNAGTKGGEFLSDYCQDLVLAE